MSEDIIFCKGGGCTAKLGPDVLESVLSKLPKGNLDKRLLVGFESSDDAAVYQLTDTIAVVQTLDFFPPMVEDPYIFGQIAATNALSDIYAMGGEVTTALNIVSFPEKMDLNILGKIMQGGSEKVKEAGGVLAGGHSIAGDDVLYGLSVMGTVHPDKIYKNNACQVGDKLIVTKPLGVGIVCTAERVGEASPEAMAQAVQSMTTLNKYAAEIIRSYRVRGCTDITGFSFLGHLSEMLGETLSAEVEVAHIPYIPEARAYAEEFLITAAGQRNRNHVGEQVHFEAIGYAMEEVLFDPQTSGGLLVSIHPDDAEAALEAIAALGLPCGIVGTVVAKQDKTIIVR